MKIETERLIIRDLQVEDAKAFGEMAADGSLNDCGLDSDCGSWIDEWVIEARNLPIEITLI